MKITRFKVGTAACAMVIAGAAFALSPSAHAASQAGQASDGLSAAMQAQLRYNPSGRVIDSDQISYDHGDVVVTVTSNPDFTCPPGDLCIWELYGYIGHVHAEIKDPVNRPFPVSQYLPHIGSLHNNRENGVFLYTGKLHGKNSVCYPAGAKAPNIGAPVSKYKTLYLQTPGNC